MQVSKQTILDLEFNVILEKIAEHIFSKKLQVSYLETLPFDDFKEIEFYLTTCNEYLSSFESENIIPFSDYFEYEESLNYIHLENYHLDEPIFLEIKSNCIQLKQIIANLNKLELNFPTILSECNKLIFENDIIKEIENVFNKNGKVKDNASINLSEIRKKNNLLQAQISEQFKKALDKNRAYLDEISESVVENRRVLAVKSMYKKSVKGKFLGSSKTGSICFIEPSSLVHLNREFEELVDKEKKEILKILINLTKLISKYKSNLLSYQYFFNFLDICRAKAQFALEINACLPNISSQRNLNLINAYHPLLLISNNSRNTHTISQNICLNEKQRVIVISGPNAGGKSITLKTIGLLQVMLQSGILVSVHPKSIFCFFNSFFTDIGDNQSIDNHLSTYSYKLKQMAHFLKNANHKSLLLVDEFGTGSDPDLGGALAEVFLENFYEMNVFGVFTTHYTNIKIRTEELEFASNANMLFNQKTLTPEYVLEIGNAGSSFTFEVAEKNKIPFSLINRARKKVESQTRKLDKSIVKLQQEKYEVFKTQTNLKKLTDENSSEKENLKEKQDKLNAKISDVQLLYDHKQAVILLGEKVEKLISHFLYSKQKKHLIIEFLKLVDLQSIKTAKLEPSIKERQKKVEIQFKNFIKDPTINLEEEKLKKIKKIEIEAQKKVGKIIIGTRVKINGSVSVGTIEKIQKNFAIVNYGTFTTKIRIEELNLV